MVQYLTSWVYFETDILLSITIIEDNETIRFSIIQINKTNKTKLRKILDNNRLTTFPLFV